MVSIYLLFIIYNYKYIHFHFLRVYLTFLIINYSTVLWSICLNPLPYGWFKSMTRLLPSDASVLVRKPVRVSNSPSSNYFARFLLWSSKSVFTPFKTSSMSLSLVCFLKVHVNTLFLASWRRATI